MATITDDRIASVSLQDAERDPDAFADKLGHSFEEYGFAVIADHGIPDALIQRAEEKSRAFFALPEDVKRQYLIEGGGGQRGYTAFGIETAKGATAHDLKEFWHVGRDLAPGHPFRNHMPDNVWPAEVAGFRETFEELYAAFETAGLKILKAIARFLKIDEDYFVDTVRDGNSVMRLLHYPPIQGEPGSNVRAGAHEDINTITLLLGAEQGGLHPLTVAIVTFALCGFANFSSIAIQMAVTGSLAPNQRPMIAKLGLKALLAGSLSNLMSAALAGMMLAARGM